MLQKQKPKSAGLPEIPRLMDFEGYREVATAIEKKRKELEASTEAANQLRNELVKFDIGEVNSKKKRIQLDLSTKVQSQRALEEEVKTLELKREGITSEISAQLCRSVFCEPLEAFDLEYVELLRKVAAMQTRRENFLENIDREGIRSGFLPHPFHVVDLGRASDPNSTITRILSEAKARKSLAA